MGNQSAGLTSRYGKTLEGSHRQHDPAVVTQSRQHTIHFGLVPERVEVDVHPGIHKQAPTKKGEAPRHPHYASHRDQEGVAAADQPRTFVRTSSSYLSTMISSLTVRLTCGQVSDCLLPGPAGRSASWFRASPDPWPEPAASRQSPPAEDETSVEESEGKEPAQTGGCRLTSRCHLHEPARVSR